MPVDHRSPFEEIYQSYQNKVFNTVVGYLQHIENAEEVTQDVFVEIYRSLPGFRQESAFSTWIYRIAVNKSLDFLKSRQRKKRLAFVTGLFGDHAQSQPDFVHPGVLLENKERSVYLFRAINTLPENQKTAFILARLENLDNKEISEIMQISVGAVESLLSRAKENLKKQLSHYYRS